MTQAFKAGAAKVDTTPPLGTLINGDFLPHYARWIHDPLHAKALVMQNGSTTIAFVVVDIMSIKKELVDLMKEIKQRNTLLYSMEMRTMFCRNEFVKSGYETWRCRTSHVDINAETKIRNTLASLIERLK